MERGSHSKQRLTQRAPDPHEHRGRDGGTAARRDGVRFQAVSVAQAGSVKAVLHRPTHQYPEGA